VYIPRLAAVGVFSPASFQLLKTNSPDNSEEILLVSGTIIRSLELWGALMTTAGLTFEPERSEKGYRTKIISFFE
jgi:hypothetical protein